MENKKRVYTEDQRIANRARAKAWEAAHPGRGKAKDLRYYHENKEKRLANAAAWRAANPEKCKAGLRRYREANKEKIWESTKLWRANNPDKVKATNNRYFSSPLGNEAIRRKTQTRRSRKLSSEGVISKTRIAELRVLQKNKCMACKCCLKTNGYHIDHVIPLVAGGKNDNSNIQLLCPTCNIKKRAKHPVDFMQEQGYLL